MGDMIAKIAVDNRWAEISIDGAVRDVAVFSQMPNRCKSPWIQSA
jgi:regulator of RNase E activity RraA